MLAFALQEVKMKYCSVIRRAPGYLPHVVSYTRPVETLDPYCPAQKTAEGSDDFVLFVLASNFVFTWVRPIRLAFMLALAFLLALLLALLVKTRL